MADSFWTDVFLPLIQSLSNVVGLRWIELVISKRIVVIINCIDIEFGKVHLEDALKRCVSKIGALHIVIRDR